MPVHGPSGDESAPRMPPRGSVESAAPDSTDSAAIGSCSTPRNSAPEIHGGEAVSSARAPRTLGPRPARGRRGSRGRDGWRSDRAPAWRGAAPGAALASVLNQKFRCTCPARIPAGCVAPPPSIAADTRRRRVLPAGIRSRAGASELLIQDTRRGDDAYPLRYSEEPQRRQRRPGCRAAPRGRSVGPPCAPTTRIHCETRRSRNDASAAPYAEPPLPEQRDRGSSDPRPEACMGAPWFPRPRWLDAPTTRIHCDTRRRRNDASAAAGAAPPPCRPRGEGP